MKEEIIQEIERIILMPDASESEILQKIKECYDARMQKAIPVVEPTIISHLMSRQLDAITSNKLPNNIIKTGFSKLDELIGGFTESEFVVIGGRPAMGKGQLLIHLALNISRRIPVLFLSHSLSEPVIACRCLSSFTGIDVQKILMQLLTDDEIGSLKMQKRKFDKYQFFTNSYLTTSIDHLKTHCIRQIKDHNIKVVMVDDIQALGSERYRYKREQEIRNICEQLKSLAIEHQVCVIAASQLNRGVENRTGFSNKKPQLSDLRDSGAIEQDADKVFLIHRPEYYGFTRDEEDNCLINIIELIVAKNSNGLVGEIRLKKNNNFSKIVDFVPFESDDISFNINRLLEIEDDTITPF